MAIYCEAINVIIARQTTNVVVDGGCARLAEEFPGGSIWGDEELLRFGFMAPNDAEIWVEHLKSSGLKFTEDLPEGPTFIDIAVIDQFRGLNAPCAWIETEIVDGHRWAWLIGHRPQSFELPEYANDKEMNFIPFSVAEGLPIFSGDGSDVTIDAQTGKTTFIGRVFPDQQAYDTAMRHVLIEFQLGHFQSALEYLQIAEEIRPLRENDEYLAASLLTSYAADIDSRFALEALRRWMRITEIGPGKNDSDAWLRRGMLEKQLGFRSQARASLRRAHKLRWR
jgi:hypothetical protein